MEEEFIAISTLNDFIFCPYSIYLHNVYMGTDEDVYHALPQTRGRLAHETIDTKSASTGSSDIVSLPVASERFGLYGKIDLYRPKLGLLIERKYELKNIYRGQIYQLWAQMYCLTEMGYPVSRLSFYEISHNRMIPVELPSEREEQEFVAFIQEFRAFDPERAAFIPNPKKCRKCIYCNLCDKTQSDNVYS